MTNQRAVLIVVLLLFGPAVVTVISRPIGLASAVVAVAALVWLVLKNERTRP